MMMNRAGRRVESAGRRSVRAMTGGGGRGIGKGTHNGMTIPSSAPKGSRGGSPIWGEPNLGMQGGNSSYWNKRGARL